jgi:hypothetical protein
VIRVIAMKAGLGQDLHVNASDILLCLHFKRDGKVTEFETLMEECKKPLSYNS